MKKILLFLSFLLMSIDAFSAIANGTYVLCTSTSDLEAGAHYIITNGTSGTVNCISNVSNANNRKVVSASVSSNQITVASNSSIMTFTLGSSTGAWTFHTDNYAGTAGYLASAISGKNNYCRVISDVTTCTITFSNNTAVINIQPHSERTLLRYNTNTGNGDPLFACYSSGQNAIYLFKKTAVAPSYTITAQSNNNSYGTVLLNGSVIMATPSDGYKYANPAYTVISGTATVDQNGNEFTVIPSSDCTVRINFEEIPKYVVNWLVNIDTIYRDTVLCDDEVDSIPYINIDDYCDDIFFGWTNSIYEGSTAPEDLFTTRKPTIERDTTFYAVFGNIPTYTKTNIANIDSGSVVMIVGKNGGEYYAMPNVGGGNKEQPLVVEVEIDNNSIHSTSTDILWNFSVVGENLYAFYKYGDNTKWLYSTNNNNGIRIGTNTDNKTFKIFDDYLYNIGTSRYVGIYNAEDWRCYTSINSNIENEEFYFFKQVSSDNDFHTQINCTREFNNTVDNLWTTRGNWTDEKLPTIKYTAQINEPVIVDTTHAVARNIILTGTGKITIQPNKGLEVQDTISVYDGTYHTTTPNDLILESSDAGNASLIFNNKNNNQATVCLYSKANIDRENSKWNWQYMGTTMTELNALYNYYGSWIYRWDENNEWVAVPNGGTMNAWSGYCITQENPEWYATTGTLIPTDTKDTTLNIKPNGYMVFANSWTAPIHIGRFNTETNFKLDTANIYLFNTGSAPNGSVAGTEAGTHVVIPINSAPYTGDSLIAPQQGFFVTTGDNAGSITLNYKTLVRTNGNAGIIAGSMKSPKRNISSNKPNVLKIFATGSLYKDKVIILEKEDFSEDYDNGWDGRKSSFGTLSPSIYVVNNNGTYDAVSAIPEFEGTVLGFRPGNDSIYTLKFEYNGGGTLYLNDMVTLESTLIDNDSKYVFASNGSEEIRFIISSIPYSDVTTELNNIKPNLIKKLIINGNGYIIRNGLIFNILGQSIK